MPSTGAADADGEVGLAFCGVAGDEEREEIAGFIKELLAVFRAEDRLSDGCVAACERPELGVVVGVGKEADVKERIHIEGVPCLEPKEMWLTVILLEKDSASALKRRRVSSAE